MSLMKWGHPSCKCPTKSTKYAGKGFSDKNSLYLQIISFLTDLFICFMQQYYLEMLQDHRSRSAQERPHDRMRNELRRRLDYVLEENESAKPGKVKENSQANEWKMVKNVPLYLHPEIERVESIEKIGLMNYQLAIHELQDRMVPTKDERKRQERRTKEHGRNGNVEYYETHDNPTYKAKDFMNKKSHKADRSVEYYKTENAQLKTQLQLWKSKNQEALIQINKLSAKNKQLQKEIKFLMQKRHNKTQISESTRIKELEKDLKYQLIFNLQLQEFMLKQKLQDEKKEGQTHQQQQKQEKTYLMNELSNLKQVYTQLQQQLHQKNIEIQHLKQIIHLQSDKIIQSPISSYPEIQSPTFAALAFTPNKNQSTSPSLENTMKNPQTTDSKPNNNDRLPDNYLSLMFGHSSSGNANAKTYRF